MDHGFQPAVGRLSRRAALAGGALATAAALTTAMIWAADASATGALVGVAAGARCTPAPGNPGGCNGGSTSLPPTSVPPTSVPPTSVPPTSVPPTSVPPSTPSGPVSTRTSYAWNFEDGTPDGWFGSTLYGGNVLPPWVAPSTEAAASGRGGLSVGGVAGIGEGAAVTVDRTVVAPGTYAVTARVRLAAGQAATSFQIGQPTTPTGTSVTDGAWTTVSGSLVVPGDGAPGRVLVAPGRGHCAPSPSAGDFAPANAFQLDQVTITRSSDVTVIPSPTTPNPGSGGCPVYSPLPPATAMIHYEVTGTSRNGFAATVVLTNLRDTPITSWAVPLYGTATDRRITWVSGARMVTVSTSTGSLTKLVGLPGATDIPARGQVRLSVGLSGSPVGSAYTFTTIEGQQTGRN